MSFESTELEYSKYYFVRHEKILSTLDFPFEDHSDDMPGFRYVKITFNKDAYGYFNRYVISKEDAWELLGKRVQQDIQGCKLEIHYYGGDKMLNWLKEVLTKVKQYEVYQ